MTSKHQNLTVLTRQVSPSIEKCELVTLDRVPISYARTKKQHDDYVKQFTSHQNEKADPNNQQQSNYLKVIELEALSDFADSMFVEDVCVMFDECAVLTRPGAASRQGEVAQIRKAVESVRSKVFEMKAPAIVDGGDMLLVGKHLFVGQSTRTNAEAVTQFKSFVEQFGINVHAVDMKRDKPGQAVQQDCMHLKCAVTKLDEKTVLINPNWLTKDLFTDAGFAVVEIASEVKEEQDGANVLSYKTSQSSRTIVVSSLYPHTFAKLKRYYAEKGNKDSEGSDVKLIVIEVDEIAKAEGALTCCSLLCYS